MTDWTPVGVAVILWIVVFVAVLTFTLRRGLARTPGGIVKRLRRGDGPVELKVGARQAIWDPSRPTGPGNLRSGPADATYSLDAADDAANTVHLSFRPRSGAAEELEGAVPDDLDKARRNVRVVFGTYAAVMAVAFVIGFVIGPGPLGQRLAWGGGGIMVGLVLLWVAGLAFNVARAVRQVGSDRNKPASW